MSFYSVCPEGGFWSEADRPTLSDAIHEAKRWLTFLYLEAPPAADSFRELIDRAEEADKLLKEYR